MSTCAVCGDLSRGCEIANEAGVSDPKKTLPSAFSQLESRVHGLGRDENESLMRCPACRRYFRHREWTPGGSDDAMRTFERESVGPLSLAEAHWLLVDAEDTSAERELLRQRASEVVEAKALLTHANKDVRAVVARTLGDEVALPASPCPAPSDRARYRMTNPTGRLVSSAEAGRPFHAADSACSGPPGST